MGAPPPPFCHKNTMHLCLVLEASKSVYHFHAPPPFRKSCINPFIHLTAVQSLLPTYLPTLPTYLTLPTLPYPPVATPLGGTSPLNTTLVT